MKKILLVEDNEMNKDMLSRRLSKKGYEVVFAMDGQQAIDNALIEKPDVILMDMGCLLYTSPSPRDGLLSRMPSSA